MLQCDGCYAFINPEAGPKKKLGLLRTVTDSFGNEIIAEIKCEDCNNGVSDLSDPTAVRADAA